MNEQAQQHTPDEQFPPARELAVWLCAVRSYFNHANHPLTEAERANIQTRNFKPETRIVRDALMRCLHLLGGVERDEIPPGTHGEADEAEDGLSSSTGRAGVAGLMGAKDSLGDLADALRDACKLCEAMLESPSVGVGGWSGLGRVFERELRRSDAAALIVAAGEARGAPGSLEPLDALAHRLKPDELGDDMAVIFDGFARLLELLRFVEGSLVGDAQLKRLLPVFALVHEETRALLDFIEGRALRVEDVEPSARELLDGTAYAIRMELRKLFEHELVGVCALRQTPQVYSKLETANGLLRDCYRQSVVALARSFDPTLDGRQLFPSFQTKLEQSLTLRSELWGLIKMVRRAEAESEKFEPSLLLGQLSEFREGSQRYLMYKDWEPLERFWEEVEAARALPDLSQTLHRFVAFLETLFGQVNMRAVLNEHPFDPNTVEQ
ncbi:MAG TPA: hypothetical protein VHU19_03400 [Pyrinomonadaceae bacterium]|nr:hypothetical protein [Pyrinomonadaceae bacterium]